MNKRIAKKHNGRRISKKFNGRTIANYSGVAGKVITLGGEGLSAFGQPELGLPLMAVGEAVSKGSGLLKKALKK